MMKKTLLLWAACWVAWQSPAQIDRSKPPQPGPAPAIKFGKYESFALDNGLKVFVVENHKLPRVSFSLVLDHSPVMEKDNTGYVGMAGSLLRTGTTQRTKSQIDEAVDFIGGSLSTSSRGISAASLTKHTEVLLDLMTDVLYNPVFPAAELEKLKKQTLSSISADKENPNAIAGNVRDVLVYGAGHPYGVLTTEKTVEKITIEDCKAFYKKYFVPGNAYLVIVGDINKGEAKKIAKKYFAKWAGASPGKTTFAEPQRPTATQVAVVDRPNSVQSVINVAYPVNLRPGTPLAIKARVLNQILGGGFSSRLAQNLREDKAYTYGAYSRLSSDRVVGQFRAFASTRNQVTDSAVQEFMGELGRIVAEKVTEKELAAAKAVISGSFGRSLEQPQTVANFALNTARYGLPQDYYANYLKKIDAVTVADVQAAAQQLIHPANAHILVVGKADEVAHKLARFGTVVYYDIYGQPYNPEASAKIPDGFTADSVLQKYIEAIGGEAKLQSVTALTINLKADAFGNTVDIVRYQEAPSKMLSEVKMGGSLVSKHLYTSQKALVEQMGNKVPVDETKNKEMRIEAMMFPELQYETLGVKPTLMGIKKIDGQDVYALALQYPTGKKVVEYFSVETWRKTRREETVNTPQGEVTLSTDYEDYKQVGGIAFPHTIRVPMGGPNKMVAKVQSIEINKDVPDTLFK